VSNQLPEPPEALNAVVHVKRQWDEVGRMILDNVPYGTPVEQVEIYLLQRDEQIKAGALPPGYDWARDLYLARTGHAFYKDWSPHHAKIRQDYHDHWKSLATRVEQYTQNISQSAFTSMILIHGAIAVGALNILAQDPDDLAPYLAPAAKWAIFGSLVGIGLLLIGQLIIFVYLTEMAGTVKGRTLGSYKYKRFNSLSRYWQKHYKTVRIGTGLIYASVVWFIVYAAIALIILV
jgi:hypothetical protein